MSKTRIAAWITGGALLLTSGVALAETAPPSPTVADEPAAVTLDVSNGDEPVADANDAVEAPEAPESDAPESDAPESEAPDDGDHGSVVSEAAQNHDFDEACGNHGAYVSSVAQGGSATEPECATTDASTDGTSTDATTATVSHGKSSEHSGKASGGKGHSGKH